MPPRAFTDTDVFYAELRSRRGASFQVLDRLWQGPWALVLGDTAPSAYEEALMREGATG